ncbi:MAG: outer-membrane lipoprotein carrier protein LolA, partial [Desulfovibrio sp.]|nr:outer-membrane lipoprotein carrier protein LolA [Desulfovibrio sp.]
IKTGFIYKNGNGVIWDNFQSNVRKSTKNEDNIISTIIHYMLELIYVNSNILHSEYRITILQQDKYTLILYPRTKKFFKLIKVNFTYDYKNVNNISFMETNGDKIDISFKKIYINNDFPDSCKPLLKNIF